MTQGKLLECSFLIPVRGDADLSDGELHRTDMRQWLTDEMYVLFGGGTIAPGLWEGFYTDPDSGTRVADESRKFLVALPSDKLDTLRALLSQCCRVFRRSASI